MKRKPVLSNLSGTKRAVNNGFLSDILMTLGIIALSTLISMLFEHFDFHESNIIIIYILGVFFVSKQTDGYSYGICASVLSVLSFNFFFTEPLYTFRVYGQEYLITFPVMLIVSIITSTLTTKVKRESELSQIREKRNEMLYGISRNLLTANNIDQIISTTAVNISNICGGNVVIYMTEQNNKLSEPFIYSVSDSFDVKTLLSETEQKAAAAAVTSGTVVESASYYVPITGRTVPFGVIGINGDTPLTSEQKLLLNAVAAQAALSIEREMSNIKQQQSRLDMESEKVRSNLLRGVSHDLRTPLTGIVGSSSTLMENWNKIDDTEKATLISDIYEDALWLSNSVDNILDLTKIEDGRIEVRKNYEAAEEVVAEAVGRIKKHAGSRRIITELPDEILLVYMDFVLMKQLLVNLLDNAVKFTNDDAEIKVKVYTDNAAAVFEVSDNGPGIPDKDLPFVFDRFYTAQKSRSTRKGMGLGLAICKSVAMAHGGSITASNRVSGGAVFKVSIPIGA